jgi:beta-RFAP synthase
MIEKPGVQLVVERAAAWSAAGPLAERALTYAQRFASSLVDEKETRFLQETGFLRDKVSPCRIVVESSAPDHVGLGTGTQLGLAVGQALSTLWGSKNLGAVEIARRIGRGMRSSLGIHGFEQGGLLVDGGKGPHTQVAPLISRLEFPEDWSIVVIVPPGQGLHGASEKGAFERLGRAQSEQMDALCRLVLLGLLPALAERDLPTFSAALYDFNRRAGELFRPIQGGVYSQARTAEIVEYVRQKGIAGVGQSSWGPAVFAVTERDRGEFLVKTLPFAAAGVWLTTASNCGAGISPGAAGPIT